MVHIHAVAHYLLHGECSNSVLQSQGCLVTPLLTYVALSQTPLPEYLAYITVNITDSEKSN